MATPSTAAALKLSTRGRISFTIDRSLGLGSSCLERFGRTLRTVIADCCCYITDRHTAAATHGRSHCGCSTAVRTFHIRSNSSFSRSFGIVAGCSRLASYTSFGRRAHSAILIHSSYCSFAASHCKNANLTADCFTTTGCSPINHSIRAIAELLAKLAVKTH